MRPGSAYYVVSFGSRFRDEYDTVDVRHILFMIDEQHAGHRVRDL